MEKNLYNLKLHETLIDFGIAIMRIPGGWLYDCWDLEKDCFKKGYFVAYDDEFKEKAKPQKELFPPEKKTKFNAKQFLLDMGVSEQIASDYLVVRKNNKGTNTQTAFDSIKKQILLTTHNPDDCLKAAIEKGWRGFKADWYFNYVKQNENNVESKSSNLLKFKFLTMEEKQDHHINLNRQWIWSNIDGSDYAGIMTNEEKISNGLDVNKVFTIQGREVL